MESPNSDPTVTCMVLLESIDVTFRWISGSSPNREKKKWECDVSMEFTSVRTLLQSPNYADASWYWNWTGLCVSYLYLYLYFVFCALLFRMFYAPLRIAQISTEGSSQIACETFLTVRKKINKGKHTFYYRIKYNTFVKTSTAWKLYCQCVSVQQESTYKVLQNPPIYETFRASLLGCGRSDANRILKPLKIIY